MKRLLVLIALTSLHGPAANLSAQEAAPPAQVEAAPAEPAPSAREILDQAKAKWETIKDYRCEMDSWSRRGDETRQQLLDFNFKKPLMARSMVIEGYNKGGVATRDKDGALRGRKGGVLSLVTITAKEDDERIRNLRGVTFFNGNWGMILKEFDEEIAAGMEVKRLNDVKIGGRMCYQVEVTGTKPNSKVTRDVLYLDTESNLITRRVQFEGKTKVSQTTYSKAELNKNQPDEFFHLD